MVIRFITANERLYKIKAETDSQIADSFEEFARANISGALVLERMARNNDLEVARLSKDGWSDLS